MTKIALLQYSPIWEEKETNMILISDLIEKLDPQTSIVIFPEMTLTGFTMDSRKHAEEIDGKSIKYFMKLANKFKVDIFAGIIEKDSNSVFNSLFHFDKNGLIKAIYRKIHPFSLAEEDKNFSSGNEIITSRFESYNIGLSICYDLRFPELYRLYSKENVSVMINIANWPVKRIEHWKYLLRARAIENQCFMVGVNRIGNDPFQPYNGCSAIFDPMGELVILNENEEKIIYAEINLNRSHEIKEKLTFLNDIRLI